MALLASDQSGEIVEMHEVVTALVDSRGHNGNSSTDPAGKQKHTPPVVAPVVALGHVFSNVHKFARSRRKFYQKVLFGNHSTGTPDRNGQVAKGKTAHSETEGITGKSNSPKVDTAANMNMKPASGSVYVDALENDDMVMFGEAAPSSHSVSEAVLSSSDSDGEVVEPVDLDLDDSEDDFVDAEELMVNLPPPGNGGEAADDGDFDESDNLAPPVALTVRTSRTTSMRTTLSASLSLPPKAGGGGRSGSTLEDAAIAEDVEEPPLSYIPSSVLSRHSHSAPLDSSLSTTSEPHSHSPASLHQSNSRRISLSESPAVLSPISHPAPIYAELERSMIASILSEEEDHAGEWEFVEKNNGVTVSKKVVDIKLGIGGVKGEADLPFCVLDIAELIKNPHRRSEWDLMKVTENKIVRKWDESRAIIYTAYAGVWPASGRDMVYYRYMQVTPELYLTVSRSVEYSEVPPRSDYVRGELLGSGFVVRKHPLKPGWSHVTYIAKSNLKGSLPTTLVNRFGKKNPQCIKKIEEILRKDGKPVAK